MELAKLTSDSGHQLQPGMGVHRRDTKITPMDHHLSTNRLDEQRETLLAAFRAVPENEMRWRPGHGRWSLIEVLGHLVDEEQEDFRPRILATLEGAAWVPIDPESRVKEREHQSADLHEAD